MKKTQGAVCLFVGLSCRIGCRRISLVLALGNSGTCVPFGVGAHPIWPLQISLSTVRPAMPGSESGACWWEKPHVLGNLEISALCSQCSGTPNFSSITELVGCVS